ncbi:MAG: deoxyribodipyrimidine photo-lyase [Thermoplasmata archaeon]
MKKFNTSIFVFRRDLRIEDNTGLTEALQTSNNVILLFVMDPRQLENNEYISENSLRFMFGALKDLKTHINKKGSTLWIIKGIAEQEIPKFAALNQADAVYVNEDYTPFSITRDLNMAKNLNEKSIALIKCADYLLTEPRSILTKQQNPYRVFSQFYREALNHSVRNPGFYNYSENYFSGQLDLSKFSQVSLDRLESDFDATRFNGLRLVERLDVLKDYAVFKDYPALNKTSNLSPHLKFGTVSIREVYWRALQNNMTDFIRQLYWRDFFTYLAFHFPYVFEKDFVSYAHNWSHDPVKFRNWTEGRTGVPIVDAGMRQLNTESFIHNRVRLIVASYLVKDLGIDWRMGEKYFASKLKDYDPSLNNGNWQWVAGTGADPRTRYRKLNPWIQQKKYDPDCTYIKKYVEELRNYDCKNIMNNDKILKNIYIE